MTCTYWNESSRAKRAVAMAEAGWTDEEIQNLENEVELARRKAEATSYGQGDTRAEQNRKVAQAQKDALREIHDREHRKQVDAVKEIEEMAVFRKANPRTHYSGAAKALTKEVLAGIDYHAPGKEKT